MSWERMRLAGEGRFKAEDLVVQKNGKSYRTRRLIRELQEKLEFR